VKCLVVISTSTLGYICFAIAYRKHVKERHLLALAPLPEFS
jgi:hypothetical protein